MCILWESETHKNTSKLLAIGWKLMLKVMLMSRALVNMFSN